MNNIKVLYYNARENKTAEDIQKYTEAVNQLTSKPDDYALQLEYIISSDIGLSTFKPFVEKNGLSIALLNNASNILESTIEKFEERNIKCTAWTETLDWLNQFREENINAVKMFEYYNDNNDDKYLKTYYGSTNGRPNKLLVKGMIDKFGESAIPDLFINAKSINEDTVDKVMEYAANYDSTPLFYEYLNTLTEKDYPIISEGCASSIVGKMKDKHDKAYKESLLLNEEGFYNYTESEIDAIQDLITFKEFQVLYDADNAESIGEEIDALYEEFEGLVIDEEYAESLQMEETDNLSFEEAVKIIEEEYNPAIFTEILEDSIFSSIFDEFYSEKKSMIDVDPETFYPYINGEKNTHKYANSDYYKQIKSDQSKYIATDEEKNAFIKRWNGDPKTSTIVIQNIPIKVSFSKNKPMKFTGMRLRSKGILKGEDLYDKSNPLLTLQYEDKYLKASREFEQFIVYHEFGHAVLKHASNLYASAIKDYKEYKAAKKSGNVFEDLQNGMMEAMLPKTFKKKINEIEKLLKNHALFKNLDDTDKKLRAELEARIKKPKDIHGTPVFEIEADTYSRLMMDENMTDETIKKIYDEFMQITKDSTGNQIKIDILSPQLKKKFRNKIEKELKPIHNKLKNHIPKGIDEKEVFEQFVDNMINAIMLSQKKIVNKSVKYGEKAVKPAIKDIKQRLKIALDKETREIGKKYLKNRYTKESVTTNEDVADNVLGMLPQSRPDKVIRFFNIRDLMEAPWMYNTTNKKTGEVPDYLKRNHDMATYGEKEPEKPENKPAPIEDAPTPEPENNNDEIKPYDGDTNQDTSLDDLRRPSAPKPEEPEEDDKPGPVKKSDDLRDPKEPTQNGVNNYYYYTYQNSLNRNSNSFNKDNSTHSDYHSNTNTNSFNGNKENDPTRDISPYHALESAFDLDPMNIFNEEVGDADDHRPESNHPIRDTFQDIDRASQKYWQKAKKGAQTVGNVGRAAYKPIRRGKEQIQAGMQKIHDKRENSAKESLADPHARKSIFSKIQKALVAGSLWKAGLLLNPIFVFYFGYSRLRNKKDRARLRNELMGELQTEMKILDDKIERAKIADPEESYKLARYKNELQKKFLRVAGDKAWQKAI